MEPIKTSFALIKNDQNQILLIQEGFQPAYGLWSLPGGHVDEGESLEEAVKREAKEETGGLEVDISKLIFQKITDNIDYNGRLDENGRTVNINIFSAKPIGGKADKLKLAKELDVKRYSLEEAKNLPLRWPWLKELF